MIGSGRVLLAGLRDDLILGNHTIVDAEERVPVKVKVSLVRTVEHMQAGWHLSVEMVKVTMHSFEYQPL